MKTLPIFVTLAARPVMLIGRGGSADAKRRLLERAGALIVGEENEEARLAIVTADDADEAAAMAARLKARGLLVNVVDRPALCDFIMPAIIDRAPVTIAIGSGGASASLAKALRQRIEALLPASTGRLAEALLKARRAIAGRFPDTADRRLALDAALAPGGPLDPLRDHDDGAVADWLADAPPVTARRDDRILLRSADPDRLTLAEARLLAEADVIFHAADVPAAILDRARADASRLPDDEAVATPPGRIVRIAWAPA